MGVCGQKDCLDGGKEKPTGPSSSLMSLLVPNVIVICGRLTCQKHTILYGAEATSLESALKSPLTFIENEYRVESVRLAFQSSPLYWVSPTSYLPDGQQVFPMVISANYFGKLLHPVFSWWFALGLETHWYKLRQYGKLKLKYFRNQRISRMETRSSASTEFFAMKVESLTSIMVVIYILAGFGALTWLIELTICYYENMFRSVALIFLKIRRIQSIKVQIIVVQSSAPTFESTNFKFLK